MNDDSVLIEDPIRTHHVWPDISEGYLCPMGYIWSNPLGEYVITTATCDLLYGFSEEEGATMVAALCKEEYYGHDR
jgi:hypothetical protein